ncbi:MAG: PqqD family protein [Oscillospiraceae bacterium]|nr:PqqD family protein [Oscillospiraceae bacterium]
MKLKANFMTHMDEDTQILIDVSAKFSGLVRSNKTASEIVNLLGRETTEAEITAEMMRKYDASEEVIAADVHRIVAQLRSIGALDK